MMGFQPLYRMQPDVMGKHASAAYPGKPIRARLDSQELKEWQYLSYDVAIPLMPSALFFSPSCCLIHSLDTMTTATNW